MTSSPKVLGIVLMSVSMAFFALEDAAIKYLAQSLPVGQIVFLMGLGGTAIFAALTWLREGSLQLREYRRPAVMFRAGSELFATFFFVLALTLLPLAKVSVIVQINPLLVAAGAALFWGEKVGPRRWGAVVVGMIGAIIIIRPAGYDFAFGDLCAILGVIGLAARDLTTRRAPASISTLALSTAGFSAVILTGLLLILVQGSQWHSINATQWGIIAFATGIGVLAYFSITTATRITEASLVTPYRYSRVIFGSALGIFLFKQRPDMWLIVGAIIIVSSGLYLLWRERVVQDR